jgi:geranylgeranyl pyrophosphate synthase
MAPRKKLMEKAIAILRERGEKAVEIARTSILQEQIDYKPLKEALQYFIKDWEDVLHPALLSLACEAVDGNPDSTIQIGAAIVLLAGGADVHDDIIDQSTVKEPKQTVLGKFGQDISILTGDALLMEGLYLLHEACESLPRKKKQAILKLVKEAFFEISSAEAKEASFRGKTDLAGREYLAIIKHKVAAGEAATRIGAILGNGKTNEIGILGNYGRTYGVLMAVRDEFVDIFEQDELKNRAERECLPLPILLTFADSAKKAEILRLLKEEMTQDRIDRILELTLSSKETRRLKEDIKYLIEQEIQQLITLKNCKEVLEQLLWSTTEDF